MNKQITYGFDSESSRRFPSIVQLALTNVCNMQCSHCPHSKYEKEPCFKPSFMNFELYKKIATEVGKHPESTLRLFGWGEPLLHPNLVEMVSFAKKAGVGITNIITNGLKLDERLSTDLITAGLDVLEVSVDALTENTYAQVRGNGKNFGKVTENVRRYAQLRDQLKGHTYLSVSIINQPKAESEVEAFKSYWGKIADDVIVRTFHDFMGTASDKEAIKLPERKPCRVLWSRFSINADGLASICFNDWYNKNILGNINDPETSIEKIWTSEEYASYRQSHLDNHPKGLCENCNDWIGASWEVPYEVLVQKARNKIAERKK